MQILSHSQPCSLLGAVLPSAGKTVAFDALNRFADFSALEATQFVYANYVNETSGISKVSAGYGRVCAY